MTTLQAKSIQGKARHLPSTNDVAELRRCLNRIYDALDNSTTVSTSGITSKATTPAGSVSVSASSPANGWWTGVQPPFAFLQIDSTGNLILDSDGCAILVKVV